MAEVTVGTGVHYTSEPELRPVVSATYWPRTEEKYPRDPYFALKITPSENAQGVIFFLTPEQFHALVEGVRIQAATWKAEALPEHAGILTEARP